MLSLTFYAEAQEAIRNAPPDLRRRGFTDVSWGDRLDLAAVATCIAFLTLGPVRLLKSLRPTSSYEAKHAAEWWGREHRGEPYVGNGDLIAVALHLGLPAKRILGTPNVALGLRLLAGVAWIRSGRLDQPIGRIFKSRDKGVLSHE